MREVFKVIFEIYTETNGYKTIFSDKVFESESYEECCKMVDDWIGDNYCPSDVVKENRYDYHKLSKKPIDGLMKYGKVI